MISAAGLFVFQALSAPLALPAATPTLTPSTQVAQSAPDHAVTGTVHDSAGAVIAGARVVVRSASGAEQQTTTGSDGRFSIAVQGSGDVVLLVRARGFADVRQTLGPGSARQDVAITLAPASVAESLTVTPTRTEQRMSDVPASVNVLDREDIQRSPALVADDVLRQIPTFSLFRRTSSIATHPTTQGVSLRGIGPSGVSRTLVLIDGVPFNDPFGGWVYWTRIPLESASRIELVEGSSSSLYGNYAMGGVINVVTAPPARRTLEFTTQYGSLSSPKFDFAGSDVWGRLGIVVNGSTFQTDGYLPVAASERGAVDTKAAVDYTNLNVKLQYDASDRVKAFFRAGYFKENRNNGKFSTIDLTPEANSTRWSSGSGGVTVRLASQSWLEGNLSVDSETFRSNFLAVPAASPARSLGRMTLNQRVPTTATGGMMQWSQVAGSQSISAGTDFRWVKGDSHEDGLDGVTGTTVTLRRVSGGRQRSFGLFGQDIITLSPKLNVTVSARVDSWRNYDAHNLETSVPSGTPTANDAPNLPGRKDTVFSPRIASLYHLSDRVSVWGSIGSGFRAPTLNELYRQFRVGARLTLANNQLGPERLKTGEIGIKVAPVRNLTWRATWFDNRMTNPISNVTITANTLSQRQNLGATRIAGVQNDVEYQVGASWRVAAGYVYNRAKVTSYSNDQRLVGKLLPQVPTHRGSVDVTYSDPRFFTASLMVQSVGRQFDDDLNAVVVPGYASPGLPKYAVVSFSVSRVITRNFEAFIGAQNLLDQQYFVGTGPTLVGSPRMVTGGVRVRINGK